MSDDDWDARPPNVGPGYAAGYMDPEHSLSSSRTVPVYVLFLIMLASGIFTLVFLWVCVQYIYHRRRVRRATADVEGGGAAAAAQQPGWTFGAPSAPGVKDVEPAAKKCDSAGVELTYVVMAGEAQPTFLARPLTPSDDSPSPSPSPPNVVVDGAVSSAKAHSPAVEG